jgi:hypothetical protein
MTTFESCRDEATLLLERVGRPDLVAWAVPCLDSPRDPERRVVSLYNEAGDTRLLAAQRRESQRSLRVHCKGGRPRTMLVLVWHERLKLAENWGYLSTAVQCAHPDAVFLGDCLPHAPLNPWPEPHPPLRWHQHVAALRSPEAEQPGQRALLPLAITSKAEVVRALRSHTLTSAQAKTLDGRWLDLESSRLLLVSRAVSPYWESRVMAERFKGAWSRMVRQALPLPPGPVSMLEEGVVTLVASRKLVPVRGRVDLDDDPCAVVQVAAELFRLTLQAGKQLSGDDDGQVVLALREAVGLLAVGAPRIGAAGLGRAQGDGDAVHEAGGGGVRGQPHRCALPALGAGGRRHAPAPRAAANGHGGAGGHRQAEGTTQEVDRGAGRGAGEGHMAARGGG